MDLVKISARGNCKWCGKYFEHGGVCPSDWGFIKRNGVAHSCSHRNDIYCSEKCRAEAEAGSAKSNDEDSSKSSDGGSSSSSASSEPMLPPGCSAVLGKLVTGVLILLGIIVVYALIFGPEPENINDKEQMMKLWGEHLEKRCDAFAEGLSEESVEARGLKNYSWDEWMEFKRNGQKKPVAAQSEKPNEPSLLDQWKSHMKKRLEMRDKGYDSNQLNEMGLKNCTFDEFKELMKKKAEEEKLKKLNAKSAELEGNGELANQQGEDTVTKQQKEGK